MFQTNPLPQPGEVAMGKTVAQWRNIKTFAVATQTDNSGIVSQSKAHVQGLIQAGAKQVGSAGVLATTTDFNSRASTLISKNPDAIVVEATQSAAPNMIAALHNHGYKGVILGGNDLLGDGVY